MRFSEFVVPDAILTDLRATTKEGAVREIVRHLSVTGCFEEAHFEGIIRALLADEPPAFGNECSPTAMGGGVAVPWTFPRGVDRLIGTVALSRRGINWNAHDGKPADILFLLLFSYRKIAEINPALDYVTRHLWDDEFRDRLRGARTREQVIALLDEADREADRAGW
jgi:mannitol/fructose-specific phosphotransferase system IIA component (Ntr-type)